MPTSDPIQRVRLDLRGQVQGVGFRPFVYRIALRHQLAGWVANDSGGAAIELEGPAAGIAAFERDLSAELPPLAQITRRDRREMAACGDTHFRIHQSQRDDRRRPEVTPDAATCADCLRELYDPADRRHRYPFINCTNCGPRYSIIRDVPYDRPQTTMAAFTMCADCQREYDDPADRRFHAQPNACPRCGPQLRLIQDDAPPRERDDALRGAVALLRDGRILAIKGIGGYHLACRADDQDAVLALRRRKLRDGKPLALMVPDVAAAARLCHLTPADIDALQSVAAPIVLAPQRAGHGCAAAIAPGCGDFGLVLPYAPLHHLLFADGLGPLVMTSANLSGQPLTFRDDEARAELGDVADAFLIHDRAIFRPVDDSVVGTFREEVVPIRRARGYAPRPLRIAGFAPGEPLAGAADARILAVGGELKSTVCLLTGGEAIVSEHLGDLGSPASYRHFVDAIERLCRLAGFTPDRIACDLHPRYLSTTYARARGLPVIAVQHHHAHIASVQAEWGVLEPVIGLACDGTGYGTDGAIWGGEVLHCTGGTFERVGQLAYFPLIGGDAAALETWRPAAALLRAAVGDEWMTHLPRHAGGPVDADLRNADVQMERGLNCPPTSSLGRVFDAASYVLGLCVRNRHEAEAAMALEAAAVAGDGVGDAAPLAYEMCAGESGMELALAPAIRELVDGRRDGAAVDELAARFHVTVVAALAALAVAASRQVGVATVALSGGCFANRILLAGLTARLEAAGLRVRYHRQFPTGDGGIALGQALIAAHRVGPPCPTS
jgi:hydrogenase maturation protein HypF